jgi:hypothetical protein
LAERLPSKQAVAGSTPVYRTIYMIVHAYLPNTAFLTIPNRLNLARNVVMLNYGTLPRSEVTEFEFDTKDYTITAAKKMPGGDGTIIIAWIDKVGSPSPTEAEIKEWMERGENSQMVKQASGTSDPLHLERNIQLSI